MNKYHLHILSTFERSFKSIRYQWKYKYYLTDQQIINHTHSIYEAIMSLQANPREFPKINDQFKLLDYPTRILVINKAYSLLYQVHNQDIEIGPIFSNREKYYFNSF